MRVAIAMMKNASDIFPGPFGHAPLFAIYDRVDGEWRQVELRDNPYKAVESGSKPGLMKKLLPDCDLRVGAQFGHSGPGQGHNHGPGQRGSVRHWQVPGKISLEEALVLLEQDV